MDRGKFTVKSVIFYLMAYIAKTFYLAYLAACSPKIIIKNSKYLPYKLPKGFNVIYLFWHSKTFVLLPHCRNCGIGVLTLTESIQLSQRPYPILSTISRPRLKQMQKSK